MRAALACAASIRQKAAAAVPDPDGARVSDDARDSSDVATHVSDPDRAAFDHAVLLQ